MRPSSGLRVDMVVMYSNPLVIRSRKGALLPIHDRLDHAQESRLLCDSLDEAARDVVVRHAPPTTDMLRVCISNGCRILHFSGHGLAEEKKDYLVFESKSGCAHLVDVPTLQEIVNTNHSLGLVFVASCHSLAIGQAFVEAGVRFAVCVRREARIMDESSIAFSRAFYHSLFTGHTVPEAFGIGRSRVRSADNVPDAHRNSESEKFVLLRADAGTAEDSSAAPFSLAPKGVWRDATPTPSFSLLPAKTAFFVGREAEMFRVVRLLSTQRIVTVRGPPGIGKTSLVKSVAHFVLPRQIHRDGVLYVSLRGCRTTASVVAAMRVAMTRHGLPLDAKKKAHELEQDVCDVVRQRDLLLVFDNAEDPLLSEPKTLRALVRRLLDQSKDLRLLVASRAALGNSGGLLDVAEKVYTLTPLRPLHAARLFVEWSPRAIGAAELKLSPTAAADPSGALKELATHPVLKFLNGHPHAITLAAPLMQDRTLAELQKLLEATSTRGGADAGADAGAAAGGRGALSEDEESVISILEASLRVSVDTIAKTSPRAVDFLCLMGLLPGGAVQGDFDAIWGDSWAAHVRVLLKSSLLTATIRARPGSPPPPSQPPAAKPSSVRRDGAPVVYATYPFVCTFARRLLRERPELHRRLLDKARRHLGRVADRAFEALGRGTKESSDGYRTVEFYRQNMWEVLRVPDADGGSDAGMVGRPYITETSPVGTLASAFTGLLLLSGELDECARAAELGLRSVKAAEDALGEANLHKIIGVVITQRRTRPMSSARERFHESYNLYKSTNCLQGQAISLSAMGYVHVKLENYAMARRCYERALSQFQKLTHHEGILNCNQWLATVHQKLGEDTSEAHSLRKSKALECYRAVQRTLAILKRSKKVFKWHGTAMSLHTRYMLTNHTPTGAPQHLSDGKGATKARRRRGGARRRSKQLAKSTEGDATQRPPSSLGRRLLYERSRKEGSRTSGRRSQPRAQTLPRKTRQASTSPSPLSPARARASAAATPPRGARAGAGAALSSLESESDGGAAAGAPSRVSAEPEHSHSESLFESPVRPRRQRKRVGGISMRPPVFGDTGSFGDANGPVDVKLHDRASRPRRYSLPATHMSPRKKAIAVAVASSLATRTEKNSESPSTPTRPGASASAQGSPRIRRRSASSATVPSLGKVQQQQRGQVQQLKTQRPPVEPFQSPKKGARAEAGSEKSAGGATGAQRMRSRIKKKLRVPFKTFRRMVGMDENALPDSVRAAQRRARQRIRRERQRRRQKQVQEVQLTVTRRPQQASQQHSQARPLPKANPAYRVSGAGGSGGRGTAQASGTGLGKGTSKHRLARRFRLQESATLTRSRSAGPHRGARSAAHSGCCTHCGQRAAPARVQKREEKRAWEVDDPEVAVPTAASADKDIRRPSNARAARARAWARGRQRPPRTGGAARPSGIPVLSRDSSIMSRDSVSTRTSTPASMLMGIPGSASPAPSTTASTNGTRNQLDGTPTPEQRSASPASQITITGRAPEVVQNEAEVPQSKIPESKIPGFKTPESKIPRPRLRADRPAPVRTSLRHPTRIQMPTRTTQSQPSVLQPKEASESEQGIAASTGAGAISRGLVSPSDDGDTMALSDLRLTLLGSVSIVETLRAATTASGTTEECVAAA